MVTRRKEEKMKKLGMFVGLGLFFLLMVSGLTAHGAPTETLKIGLATPLSGPAMPWGVCLQTVLEIACDEINSKGGLQVGSKAYELKIVPYDDKYNPEVAFTAVNRLIYEDKVKFIFGPNSSAGSLAVQVATEKEKIPLFCLPFTRKYLAPSKPFSFRWVATPVEYSYLESAWMAKNRNVKSVVIVGPNSETGRESIAANRDGYQKTGIKILSEDFYEPGAPDMLPLVTRILRYNPDLIEFDGGAPGDAVNIAKTARAQGYKNLMSKLGGGGNTCLAAAPEALEGFMFHMDSDITAPTGKFGDLYNEVKRRKPQIPVDSFIGNAHSMFMMLTKAIQNAGTVENTDAVRLALERIDDFDGVNGKYGWEGKDAYGINHQLKGPLYLGEGIGGKIKIGAKIR
jgi:branched-chain amino acid transport system substrate-binding protein